jgi:hypothetical protein
MSDRIALPRDTTFEEIDGVRVPLIPISKMKEIYAWMDRNKVRNPFNPDQHYDYVSAYFAGLNRGSGGHFPDTFKLPGHPTFSTESIYYRPGMKAGYWQGEKYKPLFPLYNRLMQGVKNGR